MIALAGNSPLPRVAFTQTNIDVTSFTIIRLISGAAMLWVVVRLSRGTHIGSNWLSTWAVGHPG